MYCTKCGKYIGTDNELCEDCLKEQQSISEVNEPIEEQTFVEIKQVDVDSGSYKTGLGKGIASVVVGYVGIIFAYASYLLYMPATVDYYVSPAIFILAILSFGCAIPSLILGIKSIKTFVAEKNAKRKKPIATLVLGINAVFFSFLSALLAFLCVLGAILLI